MRAPMHGFDASSTLLAGLLLTALLLAGVAAARAWRARRSTVDVLLIGQRSVLTRGRATLRAIEAAQDGGPNAPTLSALLAALAGDDPHPLARALRAAHRADPIVGNGRRPRAEDADLAGTVIDAAGRARSVRLGGEHHLVDEGIDPGPLARRAELLRRDGASVRFIAVDDRLAGLAIFDDPAAPDAPAAVAALAARGVRIVLATRDGGATAHVAARRAGIDPADVYAGCRADDKRALIVQLRSAGHRIAALVDAGDAAHADGADRVLIRAPRDALTHAARSLGAVPVVDP
ncbi:MAG: HAD family hydrolase [Acidobacteriota bacterium]